MVSTYESRAALHREWNELCDALQGQRGARNWELTRVLILELGHVVDVLVNDDPEAVGLLGMRRNVVFGKCL